MKNCAPDGAQFLNVRISSALLVLLQQHGHALGTRSAAEDEHRAERVQRLHYSQSGVSRMIADLEQEWGVTLLECGKAGVLKVAIDITTPQLNVGANQADAGLALLVDARSIDGKHASHAAGLDIQL